jgi:hypothetical protein
MCRFHGVVVGSEQNADLKGVKKFVGEGWRVGREDFLLYQSGSAVSPRGLQSR